MSWNILSVFLVILYFICLQATNVNPERQIYKYISLVASILAVGLNWGVILGSWLAVLMYLAIALEACHNIELKMPDLLTRNLFSIFLLFGSTIQADVATSLVFISTAVIMTLVLYRDKLSLYIVVIQTIAIINSLFFLLVSYSSLAWLNPSFILPETIVPAAIFYLDYSSFFISLTLLACLVSIALSHSPTKSIDTLLIVGVSIIISASQTGLAENISLGAVTVTYLLMFLPIILGITQIKNITSRLVDHSYTVGLVLLALASSTEGAQHSLYLFILALILVYQQLINYAQIDKFRGVLRIFQNIILLLVTFHISTTTNLKWLSLGLIAICLSNLVYILNKTLGAVDMGQEREEC